MLERMVSLDVAMLHYINDGLSNGWLDRLMPYITKFGSVYFVLLFSIMFTLIKKPKHMAMVAMVYGANVLTFELLKHLVGRNRPFVSHAVILRAQDLFTESGQITAGITQSFPSAHTATAFMLATLLGYYAKSYRPLFYLIAAGVGLSRVYLGVHYPSDVLAGLILGTLIARLVMENGYLRRKVLREELPASGARLRRAPLTLKT